MNFSLVPKCPNGNDGVRMCNNMCVFLIMNGLASQFEFTREYIVECCCEYCSNYCEYNKNKCCNCKRCNRINKYCYCKKCKSPINYFIIKPIITKIEKENVIRELEKNFLAPPNGIRYKELIKKYET